MAIEQSESSRDNDWLWSIRYSEPQTLAQHVPEESADPHLKILRAFIQWRQNEPQSALALLAPIVDAPGLSERWRARGLNTQASVLFEMDMHTEALRANRDELLIVRACNDEVGTLRAMHDKLVFTDDGHNIEYAEQWLSTAMDVAGRLAEFEVGERLEAQGFVAISLLNAAQRFRDVGQVTRADELLAEAEYHAGQSWREMRVAIRALRISQAIDSEDSTRLAALDEDLPDPRVFRDTNLAIMVAGTIARRCVVQGRHEEAIAVLRAQSDVMSKLFHAEIYSHLVDVYEMIGDIPCALEAAKKQAELIGVAAHARKLNTMAALEVWYRTEEARELASQQRQRADELARTVRKLEHDRDLMSELTTRDALTGLRNREYLLRQGSIEMQRADDATPVQVSVIDLDTFKGINDAYGHAAGDALLRQFAARLINAVSDNDIVVRLGGDEFVVLRPAGSTEPLTVSLKRIADAHSYIIDGRVHTLTASVGLAAVTSGTVQAALHMADMAMYAAKSAGGGQVRHDIVLNRRNNTRRRSDRWVTEPLTSP